MDQLTKLLAGLTGKQKLSIVLALLLVGAGMAGLTHWKHESDFRTLYSAMAPEDAATVVQRLKETGIEYRLLPDGNGVMVASFKVAEARLALAAVGLPKSGRIGFELFDKTNFGATELVEHINYQRALEGELERSIMAISEVEMARVHLTLTKDSVFLDQQQPAKASVMIKLRVGMAVSPQNVTAISHLVASAVQGLAPNAVSVLDTEGHLLSRPHRASNDDSQSTTENLELRRQLEHDLITKINTTLEPLLGADRFRAGAYVDCDLTSAEEQTEELDPTKSVMLTSQKTEDITDRPTSSGVPGTASNLPRPPAEAGAGPGGSTLSRRTENVNYETSRVIRKTKIPQGVISRVSVSVLVGQEARWEGAGKTKHRIFVPPPPETLKTIKELVAAVTGLDMDRGDQLIVDSLPFEAMVRDEPPLAIPSPAAPVSLKDMNAREILTKYWIWIVAGVLALGAIGLLARIAFRKPRHESEPEPVDTPRTIASPDRVSDVETIGSAYAASLDSASADVPIDAVERVRLLTQKDLATTTSVLRSWLQHSKA